MTVAIPTYRRGPWLLATVRQLLALTRPPMEILVVDQTESHAPDVCRALEDLVADGSVRLRRLGRPSIPRAMNEALRHASGEIILFLDDDVRIGSGIVEAHAREYADPRVAAVVGQIIQPWEEPLAPDQPGAGDGAQDDPDGFRFNSSRRCFVRQAMAGNLSVRRGHAIRLGGFDENFVGAAYRFEADFAERVVAAGFRIVFQPEASVRHLKAPEGGTRSFGDHRCTFRPHHAVGAYYYLLRRASGRRVRQLVGRVVAAVQTRHHLRRPWWIPVTLTAEMLALGWAALLALRGPRYPDWSER